MKNNLLLLSKSVLKKEKEKYQILRVSYTKRFLFSFRVPSKVSLFFQERYRTMVGWEDVWTYKCKISQVDFKVRESSFSYVPLCPRNVLYRGCP